MTGASFTQSASILPDAPQLPEPAIPFINLAAGCPKNDTPQKMRPYASFALSLNTFDTLVGIVHNELG
ncbi:MAG: hypothetical protein M3Y27_09360, partial [Acidobacteriota bacterium]|nr:hypothetical protein [Acidobacteriota bacterium]